MRTIKTIEHSEKYDSYYSFVDESEALGHHGTKGMHWGERLYQYKDGSLTPLGRIHYGIGKNRYRKDKLKTDEFSKPDPKYGKSAYRKNEAIKNVEKHLYRKWDPTNNNKDRHFDLDDLVYEKGDKKAAVEEYIKNIIRADLDKELGVRDYRNMFWKGIDIPSEKEHLKEIESMVDEKYASEKYQDMLTYVKDLYGVDRQRKKFTDDELNQMYDDLTKNGFKQPKDQYMKESKLWDDVLMKLDPNGNLSEQENYRLGDKKWDYEGKKYDTIEDIVDDIMKGKAKAPEQVNTSDEKSRAKRQKQSSKAQSLKKQGYTIAEIAKKLNIPEGTVTSYIYGN